MTHQKIDFTVLEAIRDFLNDQEPSHLKSNINYAIYRGLHDHGLFSDVIGYFDVFGTPKYKKGSKGEAYAKEMTAELKKRYAERWGKQPTNVWPGTLKEFVSSARQLQNRSDKKCGAHAFSHYFLWVKVRVKGRAKPRETLIGSGCSKDPHDAAKAVRTLPGVVSAWINMD
jgi:hypothetical protein